MLRCLCSGVVKEVLRLLFFINDTLLDNHAEKFNEKCSMKTGELSFAVPASPGIEEKAPFSPGKFISVAYFKAI